MARWEKGQQTVQFLIAQGRLESFESPHLGKLASAQIRRAVLRVEVTASAALEGGDTDGAYAVAYDSYRMTADALLIRQGLRATGAEGSHVTVEDAVSAQFGEDIPAFAKPTFTRFRRTRDQVQYFHPGAARIGSADVLWAIGKAEESLIGAKKLLAGAGLAAWPARP